MFHFWLSLPPELRKYFTDWMPTETKFNLAACSVPSFYEALNSFANITSILVEPFPKDPSEFPFKRSVKSDVCYYEIGIRAGQNNKVEGRCWLKVIKKDETDSFVQFSVKNLQTHEEETHWKTEMAGSYEIVTVELLKMLLKKSRKTLKKFVIISGTPEVNELPFDSFNILHLERLEYLDISCRNHDLLQCNFTNIHQIKSVKKYLCLGSTVLQLNQIRDTRKVVLTQNNLAILDIVEYLDWLRTVEFENRSITIYVVDWFDRQNLMRRAAIEQIKRKLETFGTVREQWGLSNISASNDEGWIIVSMDEEQPFGISCVKSTD